MRFRIAVVVCALAVPTAAWPCSLSAPPPSAAMLVEQAEVILRARATKISASAGQSTMMAGSNTQVDFDVVDVLKGKFSAPVIHFNGQLVDRDDPNDRPVPYDFVRPGGRHGNCFALEYRTGAEYLLLLKRDERTTLAQAADLTPYWAPLSPTNEQLFKASADSWLTWVADRLRRK